MAFAIFDPLAAAGAPGQVIAPYCNSFLLYFSFDLSTPQLVITSHYASIVTACDNSYIDQYCNTEVPWPLTPNAAFRISRIDNCNNPIAGRAIDWISGNSIECIEALPGAGSCHLHVLGAVNPAGNLPSALAGWLAPEREPPEEVAGGVRNATRTATIGVLDDGEQNVRKVKMPWRAMKGAAVNGLGYTGPIHLGTGFDALLTASLPGNPFPTFSLGNLPGKNVDPGAPGLQGCAMIAAGIFKEQLNPLTNIFKDLVQEPPVDTDKFLRITQAMVGNIVNAECCDDPNFLPNDPASPDDPVEVVLFYNNAGL